MSRLDVGCGNTVTPGYKRLDVNPDYPNLDYVCELDEIPEPDGTFEVVRASHVIEHVPLDRVRKTVLPEWRRVLEEGGTLWVDTPNIERNASLYLDDSPRGWMRDFNNLQPSEQERVSMNGKPHKGLWMNFKVFSTETKWNVHYWNATPTLLFDLMREAGFREVRIAQTDPSVIVIAQK